MRLHIRKQITGFFKQENEVNKIMVEKKTAGHMAVQAIFVMILVLLALSCLLPLLYNLAVSFRSWLIRGNQKRKGKAQSRRNRR